MSPIAYSYIRFSTTEQINGDSLRRQIELSKKYAEDHGLILDDRLNLKDMGFSAYSGEHRTRGKLGEFLKLVEAGEIAKDSVLIMESLDRLSREEIIEALQLFLAIIGKGIKIVTLADNKEYTKETINANVSEIMMSIVIMSRAHEESSIKAMRVGKAWENKRKQIGIRKLTARCPAWLQITEDRNRFESIPERENVIKRIFSMKLAGKGATTIVKELNQTETGWKPDSRDKRKQAKGWRESYVKKILQNRAVIGEFQPHSMLNRKRQPIGAPIPDYFPTVIDKDVFYRVQEQLRQNIHKGGQTGTVSNLFAHIAKCGYCGASMAFVDKGPAPKGGKYLVCDRARRGFNCCRSSIRYDEVEQLVLTNCRGLRPQDIIKKDNDSEITNLKSEREGIIGEIKIIMDQLHNLADSVAKNPTERVRDELVKQMNERIENETALKQKEDRLKRQIATLSGSFEETKSTIQSLRKLLILLKKDKGNNLTVLRLKLRNEVRKLIKTIIIFPEGDPRYTIKTMNEELEDLSVRVMKKGSDEYLEHEEELRRRVARPKDFRVFDIFFTHGRRRGIVATQKIKLSIDNLLEEQHTFPNNEIVMTRRKRFQ